MKFSIVTLAFFAVGNDTWETLFRTKPDSCAFLTVDWAMKVRAGQIPNFFGHRPSKLFYCLAGWG